jgi:hypothetical protein
MQTIQFLSASNGGQVLKATAPIVNQKNLTIAIGAGSSFSNLLPAIAVGQPAAYGGQVVNNGCYDVNLVITYLTGADCDECTVDTLSKVDVSIIVPKNSVFPIPDGFYQQVKATTVDSTGAAVANTTEVKLALHSAYQPSCGSSVLAIA